MNKREILGKLHDALNAITQANGYQTDLGSYVQYGVTIPTWRGQYEIQWIDLEDQYQARTERLLMVQINSIGYGDRATLRELSLSMQQDLEKAIRSFCLGLGRVSYRKEVIESSEDSAVNLVAEVEVPIRE